jgi:putative transcriptional regulator
MLTQNKETILMEYAAGALGPECDLLIAAYLTLSPEARDFVATCEDIGGALIEHICDPENLSSGCLEAVLSKLDGCTNDECNEIEACIVSCLRSEEPLPLPLLHHLAHHEKTLKWKHLFRGMEWLEIATDTKGQTSAKIIRCDPGFVLPHHRHQGIEITLVLEGAMEDHTGRYVRGDIAVMDSEISHEPMADRQTGCLCLTVNTQPMRFTGLFTRLLNPFL